MKRARTSALVRPLALLAVVVASACGVPAAPGGTTSSSPAPAVTTALRPLPRGIMLSKEGRARAERVGSRPPRPITTGRNVFGSTLVPYNGGPVISNVHAVAVDWGDVSDSTNIVDPTVVAALPGFFTTVTSGPYFTWLAEYSTVGLSSNPQTIGLGTFDTTGPGPGGTYTITPVVNTTRSLSDSDIASELIYQIASGFLPAPEKDAKSGTCNSLYVFDFPPKFSISLGGTDFCTTFCGYHNSVHYSPAGVDVPYSVQPDLSSCPGCKFGATSVDSAEGIHSHELVEATTDPNPEMNPAWTSFSGEVGDICAGDEDVTIAGTPYEVQPIWSNANGECIAVAPLCDAITPPPPSCTPCTTPGAISCGGTTALCEADTTSPKSGQCVGCLSDADCSASTPFCDPTNKACRGCKAGDCTSPRSICGSTTFDLGQCVQCDASDVTACKGATAACDFATFTCVQCVVNTDCPSSAPLCDDASLTCKRCTSSSDCSGSLCDTSTGACVQCLSTSDCTTGTCSTSTHTCGCDTSAQCSNPAPVCGPAKTCGACFTQGDCAGNAAGSACSGGSCVECVKSSDCSAPTPVCNTKTNKCVAGGGVDAGKDGAGPPPPADSGAKKDSGTVGNPVASGGCSAAPRASYGGSPLLILAGLAAFAKRRLRGRPTA